MTNASSARSATQQAPTATGPDLTTEEQKGFICSILTDYFGDEDVEVLLAYLRHCGLPTLALRSVHDIVPAFLGLYRIRPGVYDVDAAFEHLRWWPPIAAYIAELEAEADAKAEADAEAQANAEAEPETLTHDL